MEDLSDLWACDPFRDLGNKDEVGKNLGYYGLERAGMLFKID